MTTLKIHPRTKKEKTLIKTFLKALDLKFEEIDENDTEITNPEILKRIQKLHHEYDKDNYIQIDPENLWESIQSK